MEVFLRDLLDEDQAIGGRMSQEFSYPKRPKFFSHKFCRIMWKCCLANEIGNDVCWLLAGIVMTEDAKGYRSAVTYFNEQLCTVAGYTSVDAMCRARARAIKSGWLKYKPGGKGAAGKYYVTIPKEHLDWDDLPTDESDDHERAPCSNSNIDESEKKKTTKKQSDENVYISTGAEQSANQARTIRELNAEQSASQVRTKCGTFFPIPIPNPVPIPIHSEPAGSDREFGICESAEIAEQLDAKQSEVAKDRPRPSKQKKSRNQWPMFDAIAEVTGCSGSHVAKVALEIETDVDPLSPDEIREFGKRFIELCPHAIIDGKPRLPNVGELGKYAKRVRIPVPSLPENVPKSGTKSTYQSFRQQDRNDANAMMAAIRANAVDAPGRDQIPADQKIQLEGKR